MSKTKEQVVELAQKHGITIQEGSLILNESGLDFQVVFALDVNGERWVLRLPRREDVVPSTAKEKKTLELIAPHLSMQVPNWEVYSVEMIAYKQLKGVPAATIDHGRKAYVWEMDHTNVSDRFIDTLASGMASLHQIKQDEARRAGVPAEQATEARERMSVRMEKVKSEFGVSEPLWARWQKWLHHDALWPAETGLVHGDLHAGYILIGEQTEVSGFIDWTEAQVTDLSEDFVPHYRIFGEAALNRLIAAYEEAGGYVWPSMKEHVIEREAAFPVAIAEFALKSGIGEYKRMAKEVLGVAE